MLDRHYKILSNYFNQQDSKKIFDYIEKNRASFSDFFHMYKIYKESGFFILKKHETDLACDLLVTDTGAIFVQLKERIGSGMYKRSDLAIEFNGGKIVVISLERIDEKVGEQEFRQTTKIINSLHDNIGVPKSGIVKVYGHFYLQDRKEIRSKSGKSNFYNKIVTITEFCNGGNLKERTDKHALSEEEKKMIFRQVCNGIYSFKSAGFSHNDLHESNVVLNVDDDGKVTNALICDFGKATKIGEQVPDVINLHLTPPNFLKTRKFIATKFDEFTLGLLLYSLYLGKECPWKSLVINAANRAKKKDWDKWNDMGENPEQYLGLEELEKVPKLISSIITKLLESDLDKRMTVEEIVQSY